MRLSTLISGLGARRVGGVGDPTITRLTLDPDEVGPGTLFVARRAWWGDQHAQIPAALAAGASAIIVSKPVDWAPADARVPRYSVDADDPFLAQISDRFYGTPTAALRVLGVTGTNGKTSTVCLLEHFLAAVGERPASMGTLGYRFESRVLPATNTTPDALVIQRFARDVRQLGATALALEVSSHGLDLGRVEHVDFDAVGFTMLGRDHLDHHGTAAAYFDAKARLFDAHLRHAIRRGTVPLAVAFDDVDGRRMLARAPSGTNRTLLGRDIRWRVVDRPGFGELRIEVDGALYQAPFFGDHEAKNAVLAAAMVAGGDRGILQRALGSLSRFPGVPGRLQQLPGICERQRVLIDYAHTPDAVAQILRALRRVTTAPICIVLGCGGDRDVGKRPLMAAAALAADRVVLTSDNPRSEVPGMILDAMWAGIPPRDRQRVLREPDRGAAIAQAITDTPEGVVLIAGKGHERTQTIGGVSRCFEDAVEARRVIAALITGRDPLRDLEPFASRALAPPIRRLPSLT